MLNVEKQYIPNFKSKPDIVSFTNTLNGNVKQNSKFATTTAMTEEKNFYESDKQWTMN